MAGKLPIVIINGKGGCGKDSLIEGLTKCDWWAYNVSSVDKVKEAGTVLGWDGGKSDKDRKFLHDLKNLSTEYNDGPNTYLCNELLSVLKWCLPYDAHIDVKYPNIVSKSLLCPTGQSVYWWSEDFFNNGVIFMHCREPENIEALRLRLENIIFDSELEPFVTIATVIVSRKDTDEHVYGNHCDDDVYDYIYDYYIDNNGSIDDGIVALSQVLQHISKAY